MIRRATLSDVEPMIDALMRTKRRSVYATVTVDKDMARKTIRQCISAPQAYAAITEHGGQISGVLLGIKEQLWFSRMSEAKDLVYHAARASDLRDLLEDFCAWAWKDQRVCAVLVGQSSGVQVERTTGVIRAQGFDLVGGVFRLGRWDVPNQQVAI